ncbi:N-6 DNA methylase [Raoultella terrigena]|uniref:N-6 DNA methylase n=1 Tax=Raoultella terrigena TaxID=577 RepID=UPI000F4B9892|nr:N-6 DNA methylase [Raoultella terrigena]ROR94418.1 type I restriction enzyme M protein [Raoultella terrigena]
MNDSIFEDLLTIIKKKSSIRNTEQAVELISLFTLLHYIKLSLNENNNLNASKNNTLPRNLNEIKCYYQDLYSNFINCSHIETINSTFHENIANKIVSLIDNVNDPEIISFISHSLSYMRSINDFHQHADSFQSLLVRMVNESGRSGEYITPLALVDIMVNMLSPENGKSIYDPACGTSGLLMASAKYIKTNSKKHSTFNYSLTGNDVSTFACLISIVNLLINKETSFDILLKDSITVQDVREKYDFILANPPFGNKINTELLSPDLYYHGNNSDYCFLEHTMRSLNVNGKSAIILPERFLYDTSKECISLKDALFNFYNLECILSIPSGALLPYTGVKLCILFINNSGPTHEIFFYNLSQVEKYSRSNTIKKEDFNDFMLSAKTRQNTENSRIINVRNTPRPYDLLSIANNNDPTYIFDESLSKIDIAITDNILLLDELKLLRNKIASFEATIKYSKHDFKFKKFKIGELFKIKSGNILQKNKLLTEGPVPVYGGNGIIGYHLEAMEHGECIVIGKIGALCGNVRYVEGDIWVTNNALTFKNTSPNKSHTAYISKLLSVMNLRKLAIGTAQQYITIEQIKNVEICIPSIENQQFLNALFDDLKLSVERYSELLDKISDNKKSLHDNILKGLLIN